MSDLQYARVERDDGAPEFTVSGIHGAVVLSTCWITPESGLVDAELAGRPLLGVAVGYHARAPLRDSATPHVGCQYTGGDCWGWSFLREAGELLREWQVTGQNDEYLFAALDLGYREQIESLADLSRAVI